MTSVSIRRFPALGEDIFAPREEEVKKYDPKLGEISTCFSQTVKWVAQWRLQINLVYFSRTSKREDCDLFPFFKNTTLHETQTLRKFKHLMA